jgi:hypothetical protein
LLIDGRNLTGDRGGEGGRGEGGKLGEKKIEGT